MVFTADRNQQRPVITSPNRVIDVYETWTARIITSITGTDGDLQVKAYDRIRDSAR